MRTRTYEVQVLAKNDEGRQRLVGVRARGRTDANASPTFTSSATFERGGEPDRGGYGHGDGQPTPPTA